MKLKCEEKTPKYVDVSYCKEKGKMCSFFKNCKQYGKVNKNESK